MKKLETSFKVKIWDNNKKIVKAHSKKFSDVPTKNIVRGGILKNRGRMYHNIGDDKKAEWKRISGEIKG